MTSFVVRGNGMLAGQPCPALQMTLSHGVYSSPVYTISTLTCNQLTVTANTRVYDYRGLQANIFADPTLFSNSKTIYNGTFTHTLRCAAIVLRCAALSLHYRCTIASAAQRSVCVNVP